MAPHKIKKKCCLFRNCLGVAGRMLFFMAEQVFLRMGKCGRCLIQTDGAQCREAGGQGAETGLHVYIFLVLPLIMNCISQFTYRCRCM